MSAVEGLLWSFRLKDLPRAGWGLRGVRAPESVAAHSWGTALLCLAYADAAQVDRGEALEIALVHDLAEAEIGDLPNLPSAADRPVSPTRKAEWEADAMAALARLWPGEASARIRERWRAYEQRDGEAARFVRDMNLIDLCIQALRYERDGRDVDPPERTPPEGESRLSEFFASTAERLETPFGRCLFQQVRAAFLAHRQTQEVTPANEGARRS